MISAFDTLAAQHAAEAAELEAENGALRAQRDTLLFALQAMLDKHDDRDGLSDLWPREAAMAREAIAAAKGSAAP